MRKNLVLILMIVLNLLVFTEELERKNIIVNENKVELLKLKEDKEIKGLNNTRINNIKKKEKFDIKTQTLKIISNFSFKLYITSDFMNFSAFEEATIYIEKGLLTSGSCEFSYRFSDFMFGIGQRKIGTYIYHSEEHDKEIEFLNRKDHLSYSSSYIIIIHKYSFLKIYDPNKIKAFELGYRLELSSTMYELHLGFIDDKVDYLLEKQQLNADTIEFYWGISIGFKI